MALARNAVCPCGSGRRAKGCCGKVLDGEPAATPEALMRSRYTAYATGAVGHVMRTTAPESPHARPDPVAWQRELVEYCEAVDFLGLTVLSAEEHGAVGRVQFHAKLAAHGRDLSFTEESTFVKRDGRWLYVSGTRP